MKKNMIKLTTVTMLTGILATTALPLTTVLADTKDSDTEEVVTTQEEKPRFTLFGKAKDEGWDVPNVALGNGLTDEEVEQTLELLVPSTKSFNDFYVDGDDLVKYVTDVSSFTSESKAYSSAVITRTKEGAGVNVEIVTPDNITSRTEANYRNASITSGIYDADIRIASVRVMDGSGALAGIYKIYDEVEPAKTEEEAQERAENREVAQEESAVVSEISTNNADDENFSDDNLAVALTDIKLELQKIKDELRDMNEENARLKVEEVVNDQLAKQGLSEVITPEQVGTLSNTMYNFSNAPIIDNEQATKQLESLKNDIMENGKNFLNNAKDFVNSEETKGFLSNLWEGIKNFFANLFSSNDVTLETTEQTEISVDTEQSETE